MQEIDHSHQNELFDDMIIKSHYCWIYDLSRLLNGQLPKNNAAKLFCDRCLHYFTDEYKLYDHQENCMQQNEGAIKVPECNILKFTKLEHQLKVPFCIYADMESVLLPVQESTFSKSQNTRAYQKHSPFSIGFYFKCNFNDSLSYYEDYRGNDCIDWFCHKLYEIYQKVEPIFKKIVPIQMNFDKEQIFQAATTCHICENRFTDNEDIKVRDHDHLTGEFRGAAHKKCNLDYQNKKTIPVVFHNLSYDSHFLILKLMNAFEGDVNVIPMTTENFIGFEKTVGNSLKKYGGYAIKFRFIDSFRFMASSLDKLASILPSSQKTISRKIFSEKYSNEQIALLERKGVFPYDYVDSLNKLNDDKLPEHAQFYSRLSESHIREDEYQFAVRVWEAFGIKTLGEYADLYLKTDVLLLADIFENFRETCFKIYSLDPAHFYTIPGFSWSAMLKHTKVEIELMTDIDMLLFVERGIRGGISQCSKRHIKANNKYMDDDYDVSKPTSYLIYIDANALYGSCMMEELPLKDFQWCTDVENLDDVNRIVSDPSIGCLLEVDIKYPEHLHDRHSDYPICAERMIPPGGIHEKLLLTLSDKKNYVIHHKMLQLVHQLGLEIVKIHRVLKFTQKAWLKPFIELNTTHRTLATNEFEKNLYKLMSNAVYGKTMENVRNRTSLKLKKRWDQRYGASKLIASTNFKRLTILGEDIVAIEMNPTVIELNKPIIVGMTILDLSKHLMYNFHYNYMKNKYNNDCQLAYTDTDSFIYEISNIQDFYADMKTDYQRYDTSDYPVNNPYGIIPQNKKVPGLMKDENNGECMTEFVGLRAKMYSIRVKGIDKTKKAKGVKAYVLKKEITFDDYLKCIYENCKIYKNQNSIRSKKHEVYTICQTKLTLNGSDDKRKILDNGVDTLPWGHYSLQN